MMLHEVLPHALLQQPPFLTKTSYENRPTCDDMHGFEKLKCFYEYFKLLHYFTCQNVFTFLMDRLLIKKPNIIYSMTFGRNFKFIRISGGYGS
jgi:hypothetical protein